MKSLLFAPLFFALHAFALGQTNDSPPVFPKPIAPALGIKDAVVSGHPIMSDEFGKLSKSDLRSRLDVFLAELKNFPNFTGYILLHVQKGPSNAKITRRVRQIRDHVADRRFDPKRIIIVSDEFDGETTQLWRFEAGFGDVYFAGLKRH